MIHARISHRLRAFTLVELLVVISIIGILSSVTLVALQSARDRGRIGSAVVFASNMYQGWGADAFGIWKFDEVTGSNALDSGPNSITLQKNSSGGGTWTRTDSTPLSSGKSLDFSSDVQGTVGDYYISDDIGSKNIDLTKGGGYTASVWIYYPNTDSAGRPFMVFGSSSGWDWLAYMNLSTTDTGQVWVGPRVVGNPSFSYSIPQKKWTHVAFSFNKASGQLRLYIDGKLAVAPMTITAAPATYLVRRVVAGINYSSTGVVAGSHFTGLMDELAIYNEVLTADTINEIYAKGLPRHTLAIR